MTPASRVGWRIAICSIACVLASWACRSHAPTLNEGPLPAGEARPGFAVLAEWPHDPSSSTQGLVWFDGTVFESVGGYGRSEVRRWRLETGEVVDRRSLPARFFGEGLARVGDRLVQLTWRENVAFVRDPRTLAEIRRIPFEGEGWGLCFDGESLVMSDGSATLSFRDPRDFSPRRRLRVLAGGSELEGLNELECVGGRIYANVIGWDEVVRIDPRTGLVEAIVDLTSLRSRLPPDSSAASPPGVLNGIAYLPERGSFLLTGKRWPRAFEVRFDPVP